MMMSVVTYLNIALVVSLHVIRSGATFDPVMDIKNKELLDSAKQRPGGLVVYFGPADVLEEKKNPQVFNFLKYLETTAVALDEFGIKVAKVHCDEKTKSEFSECDLNKPKLTIYDSQGNKDTDLELAILYNEDATVAHVLFHMFKDDVSLAQDKDDWDYVIQRSKMNMDVILCYVKGLGEKVHRYFMEVAFVYGKEYQFVLTTERTMPGVKDLGPNEGFGLWYYHCKSNGECTSKKFSGKPKNVVSIAGFVKLQGIPKVLIADKDGRTELDKLKLKLPVYKAYVFPTDDEVEATKMLFEEIKIPQNESIRYIIVHGDNAEDLRQKFGISPADGLPSMALELADYQGHEQKHYEQWPLDVDYTKEGIQNWISEYLSDPSTKHNDLVRAYNIQYVTIDAWKKTEHGFVVAAGCMIEIEECKDFQVVFRRLARTFYRAGVETVEFQYTDFTDRPNSAKLNKLPGLRIYKVFKDNGTDYENEYKGKLEYEAILKFIEDEAELSPVFQMPLSASDYVPINDSEGEEGGSSEADQEDDDNYLLKKQEDEVAKEASYRRKLGVKDENVVALTDKTVIEMKKKYDLLIVLFYMPWCPRSYSTREPYARVAEKIANNSADNPISTSLCKVNCHDWPDVCQANGVLTYPVIKVFRKDLNGSYVYTGPLEEQSILKAVRLWRKILGEASAESNIFLQLTNKYDIRYQAPLLTKLNDPDEADEFIKGRMPEPAAKVNPASIVGLFSSEDTEEFKMFQDSAKDLFGRYLFGYISGDLANKGAKQIHTKVPAVGIKHHYDPEYDNDGFDVKSRDFDNIRRFVEERSLPFFGELTPLNFPFYRKFDKPFVILFKYKSNITRFEDLLKELCRKMSKSAFFTWMDMDNELNRKIKRSYIGDDAVPAIVMVWHKKGKVYKYPGGSVKEPMMEWLKAAYNDRTTVTATFKDHQWKPLREGYDYLKLIDAGKRSAEELEESEDGYADQGAGEGPQEEEPTGTREPQEAEGQADQVGLDNDSKDDDAEETEQRPRLKKPPVFHAKHKKHEEL